MADQQPEPPPAAGMPDPTRIDPGIEPPIAARNAEPTTIDRGVEPTTIDGGAEPTTAGGGEPATAHAAARWSGSAAVPPPAPKKSRWTRRQAEPEPSDEWATMPAVDPWAGQDTPWEPLSLAVDMPATRVEETLPAPTTTTPPIPLASAPPQAPALIAAPRKERRRVSRAEKRRERAAATPPVNRLPVQTRPPVPPPVPPPARPTSAAKPPAKRPDAPWAHRPQPPSKPRRRRRWGRRLALLTVLGVACCCGLPFAYFQFPAARQHPVRAVLPQSFADLHLRDDQASARAAERLAEQVRGPGAGTDGVFTGVYGDSRGKRVTVFGVTGLRFDPGGDVRAQLNRLTSEFAMRDVVEFDLGELGAHERCGVGRVNGTTTVVCAWADHGSLATVLLTRRSVADSAELVGRLRSEVLTPG